MLGVAVLEVKQNWRQISDGTFDSKKDLSAGFGDREEEERASRLNKERALAKRPEESVEVWVHPDSSVNLR